MLIIYPPIAKPCEPPPGIARLAGTLKAHGHPCSVFDANLEAQLYLAETAKPSGDPWSRRACRNRRSELTALRSMELYTNPARYRRTVADINHLIELSGKVENLAISLGNYQQKDLSPTKSDDLLRIAQSPQTSIFFPWFSRRLIEIIDGCTPSHIGFSLTYLSQALTTFAMIGWIKQQYQGVRILLGGGLVTSWMSNPSWKNPFVGLVDHCIAGPGEGTLLTLVKKDDQGHRCPDYSAQVLLLP